MWYVISLATGAKASTALRTKAQANRLAIQFCQRHGNGYGIKYFEE